jgi:hypothetical protein
VSGALAAGVLSAAPAVAADLVPQTLDLGTVESTRVPGDVWVPAPVGPGSRPVDVVLDPTNAAGVCSLDTSGAQDGVSFDAVGTCQVTVTAPEDATYEESDPVPLTFTVKQAQTLDLGTVALTRVPGGVWVPDPVGTPSTPLNVVLDPTNAAGVCSLDTSGTQDGVSFDAVGTCQVTVTAPEDATRAASDPVALAFTVKQAQTLDLGTVALTRVPGGVWVPDPAGTPSTPLDVVLDPTNAAGVCSLDTSGTQDGVSFDAVGTCQVTVTAPEDATRAASDPVPLTFTVKQAQVLDLGTVDTDADTGSTWVPDPVGTPTTPLDVVLDPTNAAGVCSLDTSGTQDGVSFDAVGTCQVTVTAPEDATHAASDPMPLTFTVKHAQVLDLGTVDTDADTGSTWVPDPVGTPTSPLDVVLDPTNAAGVCSLDTSGTQDGVSFDAVGTCQVTVTAPEDATHAASDPVPLTFTVKHAQAPTATAGTGPHYAGAQVVPVVTGAHGDVTLTSLTSDTCTVDDATGKVVLVRATDCEVSVAAGGDADHWPGTGTLEITVSARPVVVSVTTIPLPPILFGDTTLVQAVATPTEPVESTSLVGTGTITVTDPDGVATVLTSSYAYGGAEPETVTFHATDVGTFDVAATFTPRLADVGVHASGSGTGTIGVDKAPETVTVAVPPATVPYVGQTWTAPASSSVAAHVPVLSVVTDAAAPACELVSSGTAVRFLRVGACTIKAKVDPSEHYLGDDDQRTVTPALRPVTLAVSATTDAVGDDDVVRYDAASTLTVTATDQLSGAVLSVGGAGTVEVVDQDTEPRAVTFAAGRTTTSWTPDAVGPHEVLASFTPAPVDGIATYAPVAADPAAPTGQVDVQQALQRIRWAGAGDVEPDTGTVDESWATGATGGASGKPVRLTELTPTVCKVTGLTVTFRAAAGSVCRVQADQDGSTEYAAATPRIAEIDVVARPVDVTVDWPAGTHVYREDVVITVTATDRLTDDPVPGTGTGQVTVGADTLPVTFTDGVGRVTFTPLDVRSYPVSSTFVADRTHAYTTGTTETDSLVVTKAPQTIVLGTPAPTSPVKNEKWRPAATGGGSSNPVTFTAGPAATCETDSDASGRFVRFLKQGRCTVDFDQLGNDFYLPAERSVQIDVTKTQVVLTVGVPATDPAYDEAVVVTAAATSAKNAATSVAGTVTVVVTDLTPATPTPVTPTSTVQDLARGTVTLTFAAKTLLAGDYSVDAEFVPRADVADEFFPASNAGKGDGFEVDLATQVVSVTGTTAPTTGRVTDTWTPTVTTTGSGGVGLVVRAAASVPTPLPDYALVPAVTPPPATCSVAAGTLRLDAQGTCVVDAVAPAVARRYAAASLAAASVTVTRIPVDVDLRAISPTAPAVTGPVVDEEVQVRVSAKVDGKALEGNGELTVHDPTGAALPGLPDADVAWWGGGRYFAFVPKIGGADQEYVATTRFRPADRITYATTSPAPRRIQVDKAAQPLRLVEAQPTSVPVRHRWTPVVAGGRSGNAVELGIDPASDTRPDAPAAYVCEVDGDEIVFEGHGTCLVTLHQDGSAGYLAGDLTTDPITAYQTTVDVTLDVPDHLQVGIPTEITATATAGGLPVAGSGPLTLTSSSGATVESATGTWTDGVQTLTFTPAHAGDDMVVSTDFTPTDDAAYTDPAALFETVDVATGVQTVAFTTDPGPTAWVDEEWVPGPVATGSGTVPVPQVDARPVDACRLDGATIRFEAAGTCTVTLDLPEVVGPYGVDWAAPAQASKTIEISRHPTVVVLEGPLETERRVERDLTLEARVVGHRAGGTGTELVRGQVQFTVDGEPFGDPADVALNGVATGVVRVVLSPGEEERLDHELGAVFTPDDPVLWAGDEDSVELEVDRNEQELEGDLVGPGSLRVGRSWTPAVTATSGGEVTVDVASESADVCTAVDGTVTITASAPGDDLCTVVLEQAGDTEYDDVQVRPIITAELNPTGVLLELPAAVVGAPATLAAKVSAPDALDETPDGSVTFTVDGTTLATDVPVVDGRATTTYTPLTAVGRAVHAAFTPDVPTAYSGSERSGTLGVAPVPTTTTIESITAGGLTAHVAPTATAGTPLSGTVVFSYTRPGSADAAQVLGDEPVDGSGRAVLTRMPPEDEEVTVWATYAGDRDHASSTGTRRRGLPTISREVDGRLNGWNTKPVTLTFDCATDTAALATSCPGPVVKAADGKDQQVTVSVTALDGGRRTLTVSGIDIDRTGPVVDVSGTEPGAWYTGAAPPASCSKARDALSGLASCTVKRTKGKGKARTDIATAVDQAGNTSVEKVSYDVWDHWIEGAPLRGGDFQVKPGRTLELVTVTLGAKPQLMLPDATGKLQAGPVFKATRIDNGVITWTAAVTVPARFGAGSTYRIGFREGRSAKVTRVALDVVRRPKGRASSS